jgi:hypothetical protein
MALVGIVFAVQNTDQQVSKNTTHVLDISERPATRAKAKQSSTKQEEINLSVFVGT